MKHQLIIFTLQPWMGKKRALTQISFANFLEFWIKNLAVDIRNVKTFKFSFSWFVTSRRGCEPSVKSFLFPLFDVKSQVYNKLELTFKSAEFHFEVERKQRVSSILKYFKLQCSTRLLSTSGHEIKANKLMWIKYELNVHLLFAKSRRSFLRTHKFLL